MAAGVASRAQVKPTKSNWSFCRRSRNAEKRRAAAARAERLCSGGGRTRILHSPAPAAVRFAGGRIVLNAEEIAFRPRRKRSNVSAIGAAAGRLVVHRFDYRPGVGGFP